MAKTREDQAAAVVNCGAVKEGSSLVERRKSGTVTRAIVGLLEEFHDVCVERDLAGSWCRCDFAFLLCF